METSSKPQKDIDEPRICSVCGLEAIARNHPCRFGRGCSCWRGRACVKR
jgi:hypothetical protein